MHQRLQSVVVIKFRKLTPIQGEGPHTWASLPLLSKLIAALGMVVHVMCWNHESIALAAAPASFLLLVLVALASCRPCEATMVGVLAGSSYSLPRPHTSHTTSCVPIRVILPATRAGDQNNHALGCRTVVSCSRGIGNRLSGIQVRRLLGEASSCCTTRRVSCVTPKPLAPRMAERGLQSALLRNGHTSASIRFSIRKYISSGYASDT